MTMKLVAMAFGVACLVMIGTLLLRGQLPVPNGGLSVATIHIGEVGQVLTYNDKDGWKWVYPLSDARDDDGICINGVRMCIAVDQKGDFTDRGRLCRLGGPSCQTAP